MPQVNATEQGINVQFAIADGYYMYQSKMLADTAPAGLLAAPQFSPGEMKEDEFFGRQTVYHQAAQINWAYRQPAPPPYTLTLSYQGCADVGVCYPPVETTFDIDGNGLYQAPDAAPASAKERFCSLLRHRARPTAHLRAAASSFHGIRSTPIYWRFFSQAWG